MIFIYIVECGLKSIKGTIIGVGQHFSYGTDM